jgi:DNA-nicking Smr family endonuclease
MARKRDPGDKPGLKDEDRALWQHVTRDTKPLAKREPPPARAAPPKASPANVAPRAEKAAQPAKPRLPARPLPRPRAPAKRAEPPLEHGRAASLDRRSAERLKRGQLPVEARLDLHGYTQDQAHGELDRFLTQSQARGLRCVLVITGKGTTTGAGPGTGGVLRSQVPRWLNEPANRARVLAFDYAHKHGGLGALYVMIRRKKSR